MCRSLNKHAPAFDPASAGQDQIDAFRINPVFLLQDSFGKSLNGIVIQNWNGSLKDDRATVQGITDEMDCAAGES
jgi:hypothetical protein